MMRKQQTPYLLVLIGLLTGGYLTVFAPYSKAQAQIIFPTLIFPTPTRTPTPIHVGNLVWDDLDMDGNQDPGEPGLGGITVQLWNGSKTALIDNAVTNANGIYTLVAPVPGEYRVRVLLGGVGDYFTEKDATGNDQTDSDINPTGTSQGFTDVYTFASNLISITTIDAGIVRYRTPTPTRTPTPVNIGNFVWHDLNGDGIQGAGEPGVAGVTVQLWNASKTALLYSTTTNGSGIYSVIAPTPGDYQVRVLLPPGASFSPKDQGGDNTKDSDIVSTPGVDFGFTGVISLASNVISVTNVDAGLMNVTPFDTPTPTNTLAPSDTPAPTPTLTLTPSPTSEPGTPPGGTPPSNATSSVRLPFIAR